MIKYNIYITKDKNGMFVAFSNDYNIAIEEKTEKKAFSVATEILKKFIVEDIEAGKPIKKPAQFTYEKIIEVVKDYKIQSNYLVKQVELPELFASSNNLKHSERVNVTIPKWLKLLSDYSELSPSLVYQKALKKELGIS